MSSVFVLLNLLNLIVYVYLENNYKMDPSYLLWIKAACSDIADNFTPYD